MSSRSTQKVEGGPRVSRALSRGEFLKAAGLGAGALALGGCGARGSRDGGGAAGAGGRTSGAEVVERRLEVGRMEFGLGGRSVETWGFGGGVPGPELRLKQGDTLRVPLENLLPEGTTIHWHGQPIVNEMDGVPDVTQPPIGPGERFTYDFTVPAAGTYFYHSHVGLQLDRGVYGPLIVEPRDEPLSYDTEFTLTLDDWLDGVDGTPEDGLESLKSGEGNMSEMEGMEGGGGMSGMEGMGDGEMGSMPGMGDMSGGEPAATPPDIVYPYYLINGRPPERPEELAVRRGEKVRLRLINAASATIFRVALGGHRLTVSHADGQPVEPVDVDVVRIGPGERYDVLVEARSPGVRQLAARAEGTDRLARAVFRYRGERGSAPPARMTPAEFGGELLTYDMLRAAPEAEEVPGGGPDETVPLTLDGDEERYTWSINGQRFPGADRIDVGRGDLVRFEYRNMSMMPHPMHLHGHFFRVDNGTGDGPVKDTVLVELMQRLATDWLADNPGDWALHCHLIYHQEAGMMRVVRVA